MTLKKISCGCETTADRLVSVCGMHGAYVRQHVESARAPRDGVDKDLQRQLVVAIAPIVVRSGLTNFSDSQIAEQVHDQVHEIMRRMD